MHDNRQFLKSLAFVNENLTVNQSSYPSSCIFSTIPRPNVFFPGVRGILIILLIEAILPRARLRVVFAIFSSLASLKILLLVAQGILRTVLFNRFYNTDFFGFSKIFFTSYIARRIRKLIAWVPSFIPERLDFEIT